MLRVQFDMVSKLVEDLELHGAGLGVEGVPHHVEIAVPQSGELSA